MIRRLRAFNELQAAGDMLTKTDASGVTESFSYDPAGYRVTRSSLTSGTWHYIYDAKDELSWQKDATGNTVRQYYDTAGHLIKRTVKDGASGATHTVHWNYGSAGAAPRFDAGRLASITKGKSGAELFGSGRVERELQRAGAGDGAAQEGARGRAHLRARWAPL